MVGRALFYFSMAAAALALAYIAGQILGAF
jgi:hypothetical protein